MISSLLDIYYLRKKIYHLVSVKVKNELKNEMVDFQKTVIANHKLSGYEISASQNNNTLKIHDFSEPES